jgi:Protein of unknown function (DUF4054)
MPVVPCPTPCPPPVIGIVQFLQSEFIAAWPEFAGINSGVAQNQFTGAQLLLNNSCGSRVRDANVRMYLLYMLTAHLTFLNAGSNDGEGNITPPPGIVGRIDSATEGSVSVAASYSSVVGQSQAFFIQTKYGAQFWQETAQYRTFHYVGAPAVGPNSPGSPWPGVGGFLNEW